MIKVNPNDDVHCQYWNKRKEEELQVVVHKVCSDTQKQKNTVKSQEDWRYYLNGRNINSGSQYVSSFTETIEL